MTPAQLQRFCASLPHAKGETKWDVDFVYTVGAKMFAVVFVDRDRKLQVSFKVDDDLFLSLCDRPGFGPAPYLARAKWVQVTDMKQVDDAELKSMLRRAHAIVAQKLTRKLRTELGLLDLG
jgi:predicted DNA-binding protein (MmcQ/YjbR family)